jgi:uncharacterized protein YcfJ
MKAIIIALALLSTPTFANEEQEKILGAVAGGYLGSTIGGGDGKTAATVLGAIIGYRAGPTILGTDNQKAAHPRLGHRIRHKQSDVYKLCEWENPYHKDSRLYWHYSKGCVQRLSQQLRNLEREAYERGYEGR